jgi:hypothetical protein
MHDMKASHIMTRKNWMERQVNASYRNEYDRIRGDIAGSKGDKTKLENRAKGLERLFSSGNL